MDINIVKLKKYAKDCSVLYVEDDKLIREQTISFLGRFFPIIESAEDGLQGLQKYKKGSYDIVISDINMPNLNGIEMIAGIREINMNQIVLVTSAHNDSENLINLINLSVTRFVLKPFNNKLFLTMLYKIAKEIYVKKIYDKAQQKALEAQVVINMINSGILVIIDGSITTANKAFLDMIGFDDFETFKLEMPEVGVIFQQSEKGINAQTNNDFINELQINSEENRKVCIEKNSKLLEYKVDLTKVGDKEHYIIVFTDISSIKDALNRDEHTKLPIKKVILDHIEAIKMTASVIKVVLITIKNYDNVVQWYGKTDAIVVEAQAAKILKHIVNLVAPKAFLGYFAENKFILLPEKYSWELIQEELNNSIFSYNEKLVEAHKHAQIDYYLSINSEFLEFDTDRNRQEIEIDIINGFENMEV